MPHARRRAVAATAVTLAALFVNGIAVPAQTPDESRIQELRQQLKDKEAEIAKHRELLDYFERVLSSPPRPRQPVTDADRLEHAQDFWVRLMLVFGSPMLGGLIGADLDTPEEASRDRVMSEFMEVRRHFDPRLADGMREATNLMEEWHLIDQELAIAEGRGSTFQATAVNNASPSAVGQRQVGVVTSLLSDMDEPVSVLSANEAQPPRVALLARQLWESLVVPFRARREGGVRLMRDARGGLDVWLDAPPSPVTRQATRSSKTLPLPSAKVFFTSLGRSSGEAVRMTVVNDGAVPIRIRGDAFALVPLANVTPQDVQREMKKLAGRNQVTVNIEAFCLDFRKPPPTAGMVMGLANHSVQASMGPIHQMVRAVRRLHRRGALGEDGKAKSRAQTMLQWAIWTREQQFDEAGFSRAFVEHAKKNIAAAGRKWTRDLEQAVTALTPQRWADIQMVLREAAALEAGR